MKTLQEYPFPEGTLVTVSNRTWPGINKPGGAGKVLKAYKDENGVHRVDVKYVLSGTEKFIEIEYVTKQVYLENKRQRRRTKEPVLESLHIQRKPTKKAAKSVLKKKNIDSKEETAKKRTDTRPLQHKKRKKRVRTNPKPVLQEYVVDTEEDEIEPSIPREITIISSATSTGSLSFSENLMNTNSSNNKKRRVAKPTVRNHKKLTQAASNNRKMTEFFHKSPCRPSLHESSSRSEFSPRNDEEKNKNVSSKLSIHEDTKIKSPSIIRKRAEKKVPEALKERSQNTTKIFSKASSTSMSKTKLFSNPMKETKSKKDPQSPVPDKSCDPEPVPELSSPEKHPKRMDLFITIFMDIIKYSEEIQFHDLMKEVNKRMTQNDEFQEPEVNECVKVLEKRNRIMFDKEEGTIFWI